MISNMKVEGLKHYLRVRNLKLTDRKEELVARVFVTQENNVKPVPTAEIIEKTLLAEREAKLEEHNIPDPYKISDGWLSEDTGIKHWPMVTYGNIFNFLMFFPRQLSSEDLKDYKTSKGYSYFQSGWLGQISYHPISDTSPVCFFKSHLSPFQESKGSRIP